MNQSTNGRTNTPPAPYLYLTSVWRLLCPAMLLLLLCSVVMQCIVCFVMFCYEYSKYVTFYRFYYICTNVMFFSCYVCKYIFSNKWFYFIFDFFIRCVVVIFCFVYIFDCVYIVCIHVCMYTYIHVYIQYIHNQIYVCTYVTSANDVEREVLFSLLFVCVSVALFVCLNVCQFVLNFLNHLALYSHKTSSAGQPNFNLHSIVFWKVKVRGQGQEEWPRRQWCWLGRCVERHFCPTHLFIYLFIFRISGDGCIRSDGDNNLVINDNKNLQN